MQKRYDVASGQAQPEDLVPLEDKSVAEVIKTQQDCGFKVVSSGEYTRSATQSHIVRVWTNTELGICSGVRSSRRFMA